VAEAPTSLTGAIPDTRRDGPTGIQASHTAKGVDLGAVARARRATGVPEAPPARDARRRPCRQPRFSSKRSQ
ncbi:MAG: hypothetical protein ACLFU0_08455, partial [Alphaproteobacteria bacterium]